MAGVTTYTCNKCRPVDTEIIEAYLILTNTSTTVSQQEAGRVAAENARVLAEQGRTQQFAEDHGIAVEDHRIASGDHTLAVADHGTASDDHVLAVADHGTASDDHTASTSATARANDAAAAAEHMVDIHQGPPGPAGKAPVVGANGNWFVWDDDTEAYVDSGEQAQGPEGDPGATPDFSIGTVSTGAAGSSAAASITGTPAAPVLNLTIPQGIQGNTGSSVDYPFELVNNEETNDATKAHTAAGAKRLNDKIGQLEAEVTTLSGRYYGVFNDASELPDDAGAVGYAFVGTAEPLNLYSFDGEDWTDTEILISGIVGPQGIQGIQGIQGPAGVTSVVASVDNNTGVPSVDASLNDGVLTLTFHNLKGVQGNTGSSVSYPFTIVNNTTTDDAEQALSASIGKHLQDEIDGMSVETTDNSDLDIIDENLYSIVRFKDGHIKTKNFDSADMSAVTAESCDLDIVDSDGYSVVRFQGGHIKTKNFDSSQFNPGMVTFDSASKSIKADKVAFASGESMSITNPDIKNPYQLSFVGSVTTMGTLSILVGSANNYAKGRVDIDGTNVVVYQYGTWATETYPHGLTITDDIAIVIKTTGVQLAELTLMTGAGDVFKKEISWSGCSSGCTISNTGGSYADCSFVANYYGLLKPVWIFGDSYLDRWTRIVKGMGFDNFMIDGFSGRNATQALSSFQKDILLGAPKVVLWMMGMNNPDSGGGVTTAWKEAFDTIYNYCLDNNIEFICTTIPNVPASQYENTYKNAYMEDSGARVIDIAGELGATSPGASWYPGLLGPDNVHPTDSGAMRIALALLRNIACLTEK